MIAADCAGDKVIRKTELAQYPREEPVHFVAPTAALFLDDFFVGCLHSKRATLAQLHVDVFERNREQMCAVKVVERLPSWGERSAVVDTAEILMEFGQESLDVRVDLDFDEQFR